MVLNLIAAQRLFHQPRLRVGAIQDGTSRQGVGIALPGRTEILLDAVGDEERFVLAVGGLVVADQRAALARGEERLALALDVVGDHGRCAFQVVLFQADGAHLGEVLLELEDVADVGAAPTVDGLVLVADYADVMGRPGQQLHQLVLRAVGVLVLVDQQIFVTPVVAFADIGSNLQQAHGLQQQIIEVERVGLEELLAVDLEDVRDLFFHRVGRGEEVLLRIDHVVLGPADAAESDARLELLVVDGQALERGLDDGLLVGLVVDGEGAGEA